MFDGDAMASPMTAISTMFIWHIAARKNRRRRLHSDPWHGSEGLRPGIGRVRSLSSTYTPRNRLAAPRIMHRGFRIRDTARSKGQMWRRQRSILSRANACHAPAKAARGGQSKTKPTA